MTSRARVSEPTGIQWTLTPGTTKLTTRFFSVQIAGTPNQASLFDFEPPKVRVEIRANKKCVSVPVSASYGFEDATGEVTLKVAESDVMRSVSAGGLRSVSAGGLRSVSGGGLRSVSGGSVSGG